LLLFKVLEYAERGEMMIWDEDKQTFKHFISENKYLDESLIRNILRDVLKALHYSYFILKTK